MKRISALFLCAITILSTLTVVCAESPETHLQASDKEPVIAEAEDITRSVSINTHGFGSAGRMTDGRCSAYSEGESGSYIDISSSEDIGGIYLLFDEELDTFSVSTKDKSADCSGEFIHCYVDTAELLGEDVRELRLSFREQVKISEIYVLSVGECPDWVQRWEPTPERCDVLLISTHSDDEHLFFAGILPYYTSQGRIVAVAYMTEHYNEHVRRHERLDGLWTAGVRTYPIVGSFTDRYSEDIAWATSNFTYDGHTLDELDAFCVELFRRTRPLVVFTHDFEGEYGHGQHMLLAESVARSLYISMYPDKYPESAQRYGTYEVPKAYFHMWGDEQFFFDFDTPSEALGGLSPFEVSRQAFSCHQSQIPSVFSRWIFGKNNEIKTASEIEEHSPLKFGLYHSIVGRDTGTGDVFEHLTPYSEVVLPPDTEADTTQDTTPETTPDTMTETMTDTMTDTMTGISTETLVESESVSLDTTEPSDKEAPYAHNFAFFVIPTGISAAIVTVLLIKKKKRT